MEDSQPAEAWAQQEHDDLSEDAAWRLRPLLLALLGLATGVVAHLLAPNLDVDLTALQTAELAGVVITAGLIGFTIELRLWWASVAFAVITGAVAAGIVYWNGGPSGWGAAEGWRTVSLLLAIGIAAPLFQAARDAGEARFPYSSVHDHAWTNIVLWGACWVFVGIVMVLAHLLATLFMLIKIDFLDQLLRHAWFVEPLIGLAFGSALGLLREHGMVVRLLQRVAATVLAVLAPVLAVGLILFLLALPFTGLNALWDATSATTPILLGCVIGALVLANAVIGDKIEHESRFPLLRFGAMGLALVALPLAVLAAIATGLRIGQYGFTPERLWALTFVVIACAYGLAYLVSLARGRLEWAEKVRPANLYLTMGVCAIALVLATPVISFNAISTQDQVARLESGRIAPEKFDWAALAYDFGEPGKAALKKLEASKKPEIARLAKEAADSDSRWDLADRGRRVENAAKLAANLRLLPAGSMLPDALREKIAETGFDCGGGRPCTLVFLPGNNEAVLVQDDCIENATAAPKPAQPVKAVTVSTLTAGCLNSSRFALVDGEWGTAGYPTTLSDAGQRAAAAAGYKAGKIEVRPVPARQVFIGGVPVGEPFE